MPPAAALLLACVLTSACTAPEGRQSAARATPERGGRLLFGAEQEPANGLNEMLACCQMAWAEVMLDPILEPAFEYTPEFVYEPVLVSDVELQEDPFVLTYRIRPEAIWSDGTPVSAGDFEFTWRTFVDERWDIAVRAGYELIRSATIIDDKTLSFEFEKPFAAWRELFNPVLPAHVLRGENFNKVWLESILDPKTGQPIGNGPFLFDQWTKGQELVLTRNDRYWGEHHAYLDEIVFRFIPETSSAIQALRGREIDGLWPQPQLALADLMDDPDLNVQVSGGVIWEFLLFQLDDPLLARHNIRAAIAHGIDRQAIIDTLLRDLSPGLPVLDNAILVEGQEGYEPHFARWTHDPAESERLLRAEGCERGADGIYVCDGKRLSFGFMSTSGNDLRELAFEVIQAQLRAVGIEVIFEFRDAPVAFSARGLFGGNFDLFMAATGTPDPNSGVQMYACGGGFNFGSYCNEEATEALEASDSELDPAVRLALLNEADELIAHDLPVLPLYQKPVILAAQDAFRGAVNNPGGLPTWNVEDWWLAR